MQSDPFSNHSSAGLTGGKIIQFDDIVHVAGLIPKRVNKATIQIFGAIFLIRLVIGVVEFGVTYVLGTFVPTVLFLAVPVIRFLVFLIDVALAGLAVSLFAPLKRNLMSGTAEDSSIADLLQEVKGNYLFSTGSVLLAVSGTAIGSVMCVIPGILAAWALLMTPYYGSQGSSPFTAAEDSLEAAKAYIPIIAISLVAIVFAGILSFGFGVGFASVMNKMLGVGGAFVSVLFNWVIQTIVLVGVWIALGAVGVTIDTAQTGERIAG